MTTKWTGSGHADPASVSFTNWNEDDPPVIPTGCAKCHSTFGFLDFVGQDDTPAGVVDEAAQTGTVVSCVACHNASTQSLTGARFPSGGQVDAMDAEAACLQCHQGLASTDDVDRALAGFDDDRVFEDLSFISVHYGIAAATTMGGETRGAYQYAGRNYVGRFEHSTGVQACTECHDAHSLRVDVRACSPCHVAVTSFTDLRNIRMDRTDWDGDGNVSEGVSAEIDALRLMLLTAIQDYAEAVGAEPIVYTPAAFPYFFLDQNADRVAGEEEAVFPNQYNSWTPRLLRAAYNLHYGFMSPAAYTHNPRYMLQVLYDSLADLGEAELVDIDHLARP
ncbi:MAG: cytochrome c3 family protein [Anaerolineae bacterium]